MRKVEISAPSEPYPDWPSSRVKTSVNASPTTFATIAAMPSSAARPVSEPDSARRREDDFRSMRRPVEPPGPPGKPPCRVVILACVHEQALAERLITYD